MEGLRNTNFGGTIGGRVAYSLLHGFESMPTEGVSRLLKAKVAMKPLPSSLNTRGVVHIGTSDLTYRGFVRQIRGVSQVAMSPVSSLFGVSLPTTPSNRYRYSATSSMGSFLQTSETCAQQIKGMNSRVGA
jgi:hypothetical protein